MKIGIDAREIQNGVFTGIGRSLYGLIRYAEALSAPDESLVLFSAKPLPFVFSDRVKVRVIPEGWTFWWDQVQLASAVKEEKIGVFYSPYYKIPLLAPCRKVAAVLDLMYLTYPDYRRRLSLFAWLYYMVMGRWCAHAADRVLTCSQFSLRDITKVYGLKPGRISVIPLAVSACYYPEEDWLWVKAVKERFGISGAYVLYAGNFKPHKNVPVLLEAFKVLTRSHPNLSLVLAGPKAHGYEALLEQCRAAGLEGKVVFTDKISDEETMRLLYTVAAVFVLPSLYEGFGLPPLEAMACGAPVVCSGASSLPEVVGNAALCVDARSVDEMVAEIRRALEDPLRRAELRIKGLCRAEKFRESVIMPQVWGLIKEAAG